LGKEAFGIMMTVTNVEGDGEEKHGVVSAGLSMTPVEGVAVNGRNAAELRSVAYVEAAVRP